MTTEPDRRRALTPRRALLAMIVTGLLFSSVYPLRRYVAVKDELKALRQEERALDAKRLELEDRKALLRTDEQIEILARSQLGMVRPGEVLFVIPKGAGQRDPEPRVAEPPAVPEPDTPSLVARWWESVRGVLRVVR